MAHNFRCSVQVLTDAAEPVVKADIVRWDSFHARITIGHRRICQLQSRIARDRESRDYGAAARWKTALDNMMKLLVSHGAADIVKQIRRRNRMATFTFAVIFTLSTLLYVVSNLGVVCGIACDIILVGMLCTASIFFKKRSDYMHELQNLSQRKKVHLLEVRGAAIR